MWVRWRRLPLLPRRRMWPRLRARRLRTRTLNRRHPANQPRAALHLPLRIRRRLRLTMALLQFREEETAAAAGASAQAAKTVATDLRVAQAAVAREADAA